jgi:hypothetical protein
VCGIEYDLEARSRRDEACSLETSFVPIQQRTEQQEESWDQVEDNVRFRRRGVHPVRCCLDTHDHEAEQLIFRRYLTIIPSITPDFGDPDSDNPNAPWEPPFLELITSRHNKLKACLVPGTLSTVSITLFSGYQMCSTDLYEAMACGERLRRMIGRQIAVASIRMYKQSRTDTGEVDDQELAAAFVKHHTNLAKMTVLPVQFWHVSLVLTRHEVLSPAFLTRLSVDFILWHDIGVYICCDPAKTSEQQKEMSRSMHLLVYVEQFEQAITFGRAVRIPCHTSSPTILLRST